MSSAVPYIRTCSIWRAMELVGDKPMLLIVESYFFGARRFDEFQKQTGLIKTVVSNRLQKLVAEDCMKKVLYSEKPKRYDYRATGKMIDIYPVALCMLHWEQKWHSRPAKIDISLVHTTCGRTTDPSPVCGCCRDGVDPRHMSWSNGPGSGHMPANYSRRRRITSSADRPTQLFDEIAEIIGDRWSSLIIRSVFMGMNRFQEIREDSAIATNTLTDRLAELCQKKILHKIHNGRNVSRTRYRLTQKGRDIYPILMAIMAWGDKYYPDPAGPPLLLTHRTCSSPLDIQLVCSHCGDPINIADIQLQIREADGLAASRASTAL